MNKRQIDQLTKFRKFLETVPLAGDSNHPGNVLREGTFNGDGTPSFKGLEKLASKYAGLTLPEPYIPPRAKEMINCRCKLP